MRPYIPHICWLCAALAAFALGSMRSKDTASTADGGDEIGEGSTRELVGGRPNSKQPGSGNLSGLRAAGSTEASAGAAKRQALTESDIEELGRQFKEESNPVTRRLAFAKLLEGITAENALAIRAHVESLSQESPEFREFHYAWGMVGGGDAVMHGADTKKRDMAATLAGWASADPGAAQAWLEGLPEKGYDHNNLKYGMVYGLSGRDPDTAADFVYGLAKSGDEQASRMMHVVASQVLRSDAPAEAADWSTSLPEGPLRAAAMDRVAHDYVAKDPTAAAAWAAQFNGQADSARVIEEVGDEWAERDPVAAVNWLQSLDASDGQKQGMASAFDEWAERDPLAASQRLVEMPVSPARDSAIGGFAREIAGENPEAAIAWAGEIANADTRQNTLIRAGQAYFRQNSTAALDWLPTSGLSAEAQQQVLTPPRRR